MIHSIALLAGLSGCAPHRYSLSSFAPPAALATPSTVAIVARGGDPGRESVVIANLGESEVEILGLAIAETSPAEFGIQGGPGRARLLPGEEARFDVTFAPVHGDSKEAALLIRTREGVAAIRLVGGSAGETGGIAPSPVSALYSNLLKNPGLDNALVGEGAWLTPQEIDAAVKGHLEDVRDCYRHELALDPVLEGAVAVLFAINPTGRVDSVSIAMSSFRSGSVETCIVDAFTQLEFPSGPSDAYVAVRYWWAFSP